LSDMWLRFETPKIESNVAFFHPYKIWEGVNEMSESRF